MAYEDEETDLEKKQGIVDTFYAAKGAGPAVFKVGGERVQVWPKEYESDEDNAAYVILREAHEGTKAVRVWGETKQNGKYKNFNVYDAEIVDLETDPELASEVAKQVEQSKTRSSGGRRKSGTGSNGSRLSKEEWAEKDKQTSAAIRSAWAVQEAARLVLASEKNPTLEQIEKTAVALLGVAENVRQKILSSSSSASTTEPAAAEEVPF